MAFDPPAGATGPDHAVAIIGAGFSGIGAAIKLREAGIDDFVMIERSAGVGGTWRDNTYPGCACDVEAHLYSFSFEQNPYWSHRYAPQPEIRAYLESVCAKHALHEKLRLDRFLVAADWDAHRQYWRLHLTPAADIAAYIRRKGLRSWAEIDYADPALPRGQVLTARTLIAGMGPLSRPAYPDIAGLDRFKGPLFHSAQWDPEVDLRGKRVAVIGTGSSAAQFVPAIAAEVAQLDVYQRTPNWIWPRKDRPISEAEQARYARSPFLRALRRLQLYLGNESRALGLVVNPRLMKLAERVALRHLRQQVSDPVLREKLTPRYQIGCKRIVVSDDWFPVFARDNVTLITEGIREVVPEGIVMADGRLRAAEVIILGTGFDVQAVIPRGLIRGRDGRDVWDYWRDGVGAYLGTTVHGLPNFFMLLGPNSGLGHNSMVYMIESQLHYIVQALQSMRAGNIRALEPRAAVQADYNARIQRRGAGTVFEAGCRSWYLDANGNNVAIWPGFSFQFRRASRHFERADYQVVEAAAA